MDTPLLVEYAEIVREIKAKEEKRDAIKEKVVAHLKGLGLQKFIGPMGTFSIGTRPTWKYSPEVDALAAKVKERKAEEEATGLAVASETEYLKFQ